VSAAPTDLTGTQYLRLLINDAGADALRRDRAAAVLAGIENRRDLKPGKKAVAEEGARLAGWKTEWWRLLNDWDAPDFNPDGLTPADRAVWDAKQRAKPARQDNAPKAAEHSGLPEWDALLGPRLPRETIPRSEDYEWDADLDPTRRR
jgi:hypothetical protein